MRKTMLKLGVALSTVLVILALTVAVALADSPHFVSASAKISGANPSASNKTTVQGPVSATGSFSSGKNGNVTASLTLTPPPPPATFSCPKGQHQETAEVTYTDVSITDTTHGITEPIPGTFDTGCLLPNVRGAC